jgi:hypothetical protein
LKVKGEPAAIIKGGAEQLGLSIPAFIYSPVSLLTPARE